MKHQQLKLNNGLETLFLHSPSTTAATVQIWFRAGSALESKEDQGTAHFLEHMFFKGTPERPGSTIAHQVESYGGELNAFTSFDYTCYYINTPNSHLSETIDILLDMVSNPQFLEQDLIPERDVVFEEYRRSMDNPGQYVFHRLQTSGFSGAYAHPILGSEKSIKNFDRDQIINFRKQHYNLSNALLVVAGDLEKQPQEKLTKKIESFQLPDGPPSKFPSFKLKKKSTIDVHRKETRMAQMIIALQAPDFTEKDASSEDLAFNCLGQGETSKLYRHLVLQDSLANNTASSTLFMSRGGVHVIKVAFPEANLTQVLKELTNTFRSVYNEGFSKEEVKRVKNQYVASKVYDMESIESRAFSLGHGHAQSGDISAEDEFIDRVRRVTTGSVNSSVKDIFERPLHVSLQLPKENPQFTQQAAKKKVEKFVSDIGKLSTKTKAKKGGDKVALSEYDDQVKLVTLKKGVKLLYRQSTMTPTFVLHAYLKGGLTEETQKTNGSYHLLSSLLTKGYKGKKYEELKELLENRSASLSGFTGKNAYGMTMHGQTEHFGELAEVFTKSLLKPELPGALLKHEKEMTLRTIESHKEDPVRVCFENASKTFFNKHPYSQSILGSESAIKGMTKKHLSELHQSNVERKEILLTYCGDLEIEDVQEYLRPLISQLGPRGEKKVKPKKVSPLQGKKTFISFDREQTHMFMGIPIGDLSSSDNLYLKMLTAHLSGQSSELFVEVRDRQGLCYTAQPIHFMALEAGFWGIYIASGHDKVEAAQKALFEIIDNIKKKGLSKQEFTRIKKMIEGQSLINVQTNDDFASIYSVPILQGQGLDYYHKSNEAVRNLKHQDFQKNIKEILSRDWSTVVVGRSEA